MDESIERTIQKYEETGDIKASLKAISLIQKLE